MMSCSREYLMPFAQSEHRNTPLSGSAIIATTKSAGNHCFTSAIAPTPDITAAKRPTQLKDYWFKDDASLAFILMIVEYTRGGLPMMISFISYFTGFSASAGMPLPARISPVSIHGHVTPYVGRRHFSIQPRAATTFTAAFIDFSHLILCYLLSFRLSTVRW